LKEQSNFFKTIYWFLQFGANLWFVQRAATMLDDCASLGESHILYSISWIDICEETINELCRVNLRHFFKILIGELRN